MREILRTTVTPLLVQEDTSLVVSEPKWSQLQELRQESRSLGADRLANKLASPIARAKRFDKFYRYGIILFLVEQIQSNRRSFPN